MAELSGQAGAADTNQTKPDIPNLGRRGMRAEFGPLQRVLGARVRDFLKVILFDNNVYLCNDIH